VAYSHPELKFINAPNLLTLMRIVFVPLVIGLLFIGTYTGDLFAALAFGIAAITDYFDGYLARKQKLVTVYGKLMDPLADKFLVISTIIMLQHLGRIHPIVVMVLVCREIAVTGLRALASAEGVVIAASESAKLKTAVQMSAIPMILVGHLWGIPLLTVGNVLLWLSVGISLWSAKAYVVGFIRAMREGARKKAAERRAARAARLEARRLRWAAKGRSRERPEP
jgi:CDP-diacylglycerol---glycerol-3-phosphate 3-phosphatidyltransferase